MFHLDALNKVSGNFNRWASFPWYLNFFYHLRMMAPIGVFDSGFGGLTVLKAIREKCPEYDYLYLGDNAKSPYGTRSYENVYHLTLAGVKYLFKQGCHLIILACNTASAKALRTIQQNDLESIDPAKRVLGVVRPTVESIGENNGDGRIGLFATPGTVDSDSYAIELKKFFPRIHLVQESCPMWVPLVENGEIDGSGTDYFVKKHIDQLLSKSEDIQKVVLACTHYPLLYPIIRKHLPEQIKIIEQGKTVALKLEDYLNRHPEIERLCSKGGGVKFLTTDNKSFFDKRGSQILGSEVNSSQVEVPF